MRVAKQQRPNLTVGVWLMVSVLACLTPEPALADQFSKYNNEGNRLATEGRLDEALGQYQNARVERPHAPEIDYNIGNVYHQKGAFDTALAAYQNALGGLSDELLPATYFNMGNTLFRQGEYQPAVEAYKRALIKNPADQDAKFNLELALRELAADSSQQQESDQKQDQNSTGEQEENPQEDRQESPDSTQQQQNSNGQDEETEEDKSSEDQQEQEQPQAEPDQAQAPETQGMTPEDAERLLDALRENETDLQKKRAQRMATPVPVLKDW